MYTRGGISSIDQSNNLYFLVVHRRLAPPPDAYGTLRGILNPRARATKPEREHTGVSRVNPTLNTHTRSSKKKSEIQHPVEVCSRRSKSALYAQTVTFPRNQPPPRTPASRRSAPAPTDRRRRRRARRATRRATRRDAKNESNKKSHARLPMRRLPIPRRNVNRRRSSESTTVDRILLRLVLVLLPRPRSPTDGVVEVVV